MLGVPPPVMATVGAVNPKPASVTPMLVTTPGEIVEWADAGAVGVMPGEVIVTTGGVA